MYQTTQSVSTWMSASYFFMDGSLCKQTAQAVAKYTDLCVKLSLRICRLTLQCSLLSTCTPPQVISEPLLTHSYLVEEGVWMNFSCSKWTLSTVNTLPTYSLGHMWCPFTDQWTPWMISRWKFISSSLVTSRVIASDICAYGLHVESRNLNREVFISHIDNHSIQLMLSDGDSTWGCLGKTNFDCTAGYSYSLGRVKQTAVFFNVTVEEGRGRWPSAPLHPLLAYLTSHMWENFVRSLKQSLTNKTTNFKLATTGAQMSVIHFLSWSKLHIIIFVIPIRDILLPRLKQATRLALIMYLSRSSPAYYVTI